MFAGQIFKSLCLYLGGFCAVGMLLGQSGTLRETLAEGQAAFSAGDYVAASRIFEEIESTFGREPEVDNPEFKKVMLPIRGYAALLAENPELAVRLLSAFIEQFPDDPQRQTFVLFTLAQAQTAAGQSADAVETYRDFVRRAPNRPEAGLATLEAARLLFDLDQVEAAFDALDALYEGTLQSILRTQGRLLALQEAVARGHSERARRYILETEWQLDSMPELAVLSFAALQMGQRFLEQRNYADAIRTFRLVPPRERLIQAQAERLESTRERFEQRREQVGIYQGGLFWTQFYTRLINRLEGQLRGLRESEDYTVGLYLSLGQAYLLDGRTREAWIVFERLARNENLGTEERTQAHYRWILTAIELGVWEDAFEIAKGFAERYPDTRLAPDALYLLSRAYQGNGDYREAIGVLSDLLARYGDHNLAPRWRFMRGFNYNLLNESEAAREDFARFIRAHPTHGLILDVRMWHALTHFAERDYRKALDELAALQPDVRGGRLEGEIDYRIASIHYAMRDFEKALDGINAFLSRFERHSRTDEARVLLGDIQMGMGELSTARQTFARIDPSAGHLFVYAQFQAGKILRAVAEAIDPREENAEARRAGLLAGHIEHFQNYVDRGDVPGKTRVSEALYWIGWTYQELGQPQRARPVFEDALARFGNEMDAEEVPAIIEALGRLERAASGLPRQAADEAFLTWVETQRKQALAREELTYYARLNLFLDDHYRQRGDTENASRILFQTVENVPIEKLGPESLGRVGVLLSENYPILAKAYLDELLDSHPESRQRVYGFFGNARLSMAEAEYETARNFLARFRNEAPLHPLATDATLLYSETLTKTGAYEEASELLEELLRLREARGRPHATALLNLSRNAEAAGELNKAIAYAQRVYTVYRAYPDLLAQAYLLNVRQFEALGEIEKALNTVREMLAESSLRGLEAISEAEFLRSRLESLLPSSESEQARWQKIDGKGRTRS